MAFHLQHWWKKPGRERLGYLRGRWVALQFWMAGNCHKPPVITAPPALDTQAPQVAGFGDYYQAVAAAYQYLKYPGAADVFVSDETQLTFREWDNSGPAQRAAAALGGDEVQLWIAALPPTGVDLTPHACLLSPDERERAARFGVLEARRQFVFGRAILRQLLGACLRIDPAALALGYQPRGKPVVAQSTAGENLRFNLSHSGRLVAVALAWGREVGVDIEQLQQLDDGEHLAGRIFSTRELCELRALPKHQQQEAFFNGWTRKEAYLKATGEGLTDALPAIEVTLAPGKAPELLGLPAAPEAMRQWSIQSIPMPPGFVGAVVIARVVRPVAR